MRTAAFAIVSAFAVTVSHAAVAVAQTTVVQNPNGGTTTTTVQTDAAGRTTVMMQTVAGGNGQAVPAPPPLPGGSGGVASSIIGAPGVGGPSDVPLPFAPRDNAPLAVGTATLRGRVTATDTGRPLRRVLIRASAQSAREARTVNTDQNGRWELKDLPAGSYVIQASRSGYVTAGFDQPRMTGPGRPVTVADHETRENVDISLTPGGVIVGRIVDEFGDPVADAMVTATRLQYMGGGVRRPLMAAAPSSSNDIGEFRIYGLAPGNYYLSAMPRGVMNPFDTPVDRVAYGQTFYPAAADMANAQRIAVRAGDNIAGIVIALTPSRSARITGRAIGADGAPLRTGTVMMSATASPMFMGSNGTIRPDGTFSLTNVPPGDYTLRTTVMGPPTQGQPPMFATADVSVNGADIDGVVLQPRAPVTITGRLVGDPTVLSRIDPSRVRLMAAGVGPQITPGPPQPPQPLGADLSFTVQALPGQVSIRPLTLPDLLVRSVRLDGRDATKGFAVSAGAFSGTLEVEVVASTSKVVVAVSNGRGETAASRDIVVFPQDESGWGVALPGHSATGQTNKDGTFETPVLVPGTYYVTLADGLEPGDANDPEILSELRTRAQRVTLRDGETATVQLRTSDR